MADDPKGRRLSTCVVTRYVYGYSILLTCIVYIPYTFAGTENVHLALDYTFFAFQEEVPGQTSTSLLLTYRNAI